MGRVVLFLSTRKPSSKNLSRYDPWCGCKLFAFHSCFFIGSLVRCSFITRISPSIWFILHRVGYPDELRFSGIFSPRFDSWLFRKLGKWQSRPFKFRVFVIVIGVSSQTFQDSTYNIFVTAAIVAFFSSDYEFLIISKARSNFVSSQMNSIVLPFPIIFSKIWLIIFSLQLAIFVLFPVLENGFLIILKASVIDKR